MIELGSRCKKEREANIKKLITQISVLETLHKQSPSIDLAKEPTRCQKRPATVA